MLLQKQFDPTPWPRENGQSHENTRPQENTEYSLVIPLTRHLMIDPLLGAQIKSTHDDLADRPDLVEARIRPNWRSSSIEMSSKYSAEPAVSL
jgi:hypothetical protein